MSEDPDPDDVAQLLLEGIRQLVRRVRQTQGEGGLTMPESSALARLDRSGPTTSSALAKLEQISPQSMGATFAALEARGLVARQPDPQDGRRVVLSVTDAGREVLRTRRNARVEKLAEALADGFTPEELGRLAAAAPLIERLARSV
ncbi:MULTISPECIES: MarR family winged helix-turn-helix transcriptional regulator [unclassified Streptomyces]|uniref:MarR family winged helix-turn-helix transcriptional regulator n=1 Tax=unclassified Streptomyces TaxID=2593676 RepID=UPI002E2BF725|nr:MarR family transcriptional regulator [Streptomyces sp. NBC_00223]